MAIGAAVAATQFEMQSYPGEQVAGMKRFNQVIVAACFQAFETEIFAGAGRQQYDRHVA
jgi:hypothetical protein